MNELVQTSTSIVNPATGNTLDLRNDATDLIAAERRDVIELREALSSYASYLDEELVRRLDHENTRSAVVGQFRIETKAPTTLTFDPGALAVALMDLIAEDVLAESVYHKCLIPQPEKVNRREVEKLLRHSDARVREHIAAAGEESEQRRTVSVKPR